MKQFDARYGTAAEGVLYEEWFYQRAKCLIDRYLELDREVFLEDFYE